MGPYTFTAIADGPVYGDETFRFSSSSEKQDFPSTEPYICESAYEVVRVGDAVHVADVDGWETCYVDPELDRRLRDSAIDAFTGWAATL